MDNSTLVPNVTTTESSVPGDEEDFIPVSDDFKYLFVPLASFLVLVVLTIGVIMLLQRKRKIERLRHHLMPFYNFAPGEEEDWETELLENENEPQTRRDYNSVSFQKSVPSSGEVVL